MFSYVLFASGNHLWENTADLTRSKRLQVTRACGLEDPWMFGPFWRCHDVTMCFSGPPELMQSESVPEWCRQCFLDETSERCTSELQPKTFRFLTCFTTFHALTCVLCASFWKVSWHCDDEPLFDATGVVSDIFPILFASPSHCSLNIFEQIAV